MSWVIRRGDWSLHTHDPLFQNNRRMVGLDWRIGEPKWDTCTRIRIGLGWWLIELAWLPKRFRG